MSGLNNPFPQTIPYMTLIPGLFAKYLSRTTGLYYGALGVSSANSTSTAVANKIYAIPFLVMAAESFDRIAIAVTTGAAGNARLGIYADNNFKPGALVLDAGAVDTTDAEDKEITINQALQPGLYWLAVLYDATPVVKAPSYSINLLGFGSTSIGSGSVFGAYTTQAYGALPDPHPTPTMVNATCHGISLRRA